MTSRPIQLQQAKRFPRKRGIRGILVALGLLACGSVFGSELSEKIQKELDSNPVLRRQQVKMRVLQEKNGCVALEMTEGPKVIRDLLRKGLEVDGAGFSLTSLQKDSLTVLMGVRKSLRNIKRLDGVKEVTITGALNSVQDQAESLYTEALQQLNREPMIVDDQNARAKAVKMLVRAAELGYLRAQSDLGAAYAFGIGVDQDNEQAVFWFRKAAENGDAAALFNLGKMYAAGQGISQDFKQAMQCYRKAAEYDYPPETAFKAYNTLAALLATCPDESMRDGPAALEYVQKALAVNYPNKSAAIETLAAAYARCGRFKEAVEEERKFIDQLKKLNSIDSAEKEKLLADAQKRLELYQNKQAYVDSTLELKE